MNTFCLLDETNHGLCDEYIVRLFLLESSLNKNPLKLGGRCCPIPGQASSNNGGEKRGGIIKKYHKRITHRIKNENKTNPIFIVWACAHDQATSKNLSDFATSPVKESHDYNILRQIFKFNIDSPGAVCVQSLH